MVLLLFEEVSPLNFSLELFYVLQQHFTQLKLCEHSFVAFQGSALGWIFKVFVVFA